MYKTTPDPGALFIWNLKKTNQFISAFAANDPDSTFKVWKLIENKLNNKKVCFFLNSRNDRRYRTLQLINMVLTKINPDLFLIRADGIDNLISKYNSSTIVKLLPMQSNQNDIISYLMDLNKYSIIGIGNIVGWGDIFLNKLKEHRI